MNVNAATRANRGERSFGARHAIPPSIHESSANMPSTNTHPLAAEVVECRRLLGMSKSARATAALQAELDALLAELSSDLEDARRALAQEGRARDLDHAISAELPTGRICVQGSLRATPIARLQQQEPARPPQPQH